MENTQDLASIQASLDRIGKTLETLAERQRRQEELIAEMSPIARSVMDVAVQRLDLLEKQGWFNMLEGVQVVGARIAASYGPEDYEQLAGAVVGILDTVRNLTQPDVLAIGNEVGDVLHDAGKLEPVSVLGMARAAQEEDVQKGMAVLFEVLRHVGRAAGHVEAGRRAAPRLAAPAAPRPAPAASPTLPPRKAQACATPAPEPGLDPSAWTREIALTLAAEAGVELGEAHWSVLDAARKEYFAAGASPNIRRLTQVAGVSTKELYALFPKAPGRTVSRLAGIPKPAGCI